MNSRNRQTRGRGGMTILEVVLAVFMLGLLAASVAGTVNTSNAMEARTRRSIAAHEVANRLVLTWLDDKKRMPATGSPIEYGDERFVWSKKVRQVRMKVNGHQAARGAPLGLDRFRCVTMEVYGEADGTKGELLARISRVYDPGAARNVDSARGLTRADIPEFLSVLLGGGQDLDDKP